MEYEKTAYTRERIQFNTNTSISSQASISTDTETVNTESTAQDWITETELTSNTETTAHSSTEGRKYGDAEAISRWVDGAKSSIHFLQSSRKKKRSGDITSASRKLNGEKRSTHLFHSSRKKRRSEDNTSTPRWMDGAHGPFNLLHSLSINLDLPDLSVEMDEAFQKISEANRNAVSFPTSPKTPSTPVFKPSISPITPILDLTSSLPLEDTVLASVQARKRRHGFGWNRYSARISERPSKSETFDKCPSSSPLALAPTATAPTSGDKDSTEQDLQETAESSEFQALSP